MSASMVSISSVASVVRDLPYCQPLEKSSMLRTASWVEDDAMAIAANSVSTRQFTNTGILIFSISVEILWLVLCRLSNQQYQMFQAHILTFEPTP